MGWTLKGVAFQHNGAPTPVRADGNNTARVCPLFGAPAMLGFPDFGIELGSA